MINKRFFFSTFFIVFAFFLGYFFEKKNIEEQLSKEKNEKEYVNIIIKNKKLEFIRSSPKVEVLINGSSTQSGSITLQ